MHKMYRFVERSKLGASISNHPSLGGGGNCYSNNCIVSSPSYAN